MDLDDIPADYRGWWRITETSQWSSRYLDSLGPALLSLTGHDDRLRMHCLVAYVNCKPTKTGISFTWEGAWEYDPMSGSGRVTTRRGFAHPQGRYAQPLWLTSQPMAASSST